VKIGAQVEASARKSYLFDLQCKIMKTVVNIATEDVKIMMLEIGSCM
jgi:hypothetical protein